MARRPLKIGVLLGDPRLPYSFSHEGRLGEGERTAVHALRATLDGMEGFSSTIFDDHERLIDDLRGADLDLALNFCDTGYRNNPKHVAHIPALCEMLGIPYTGADGMAMYLTWDKSLVRAFAINLNIPVPNETVADLRADPLLLPEFYPALIKPNAGGGSFGITEDSVVHGAEEATAYMNWLAERIDPAEAVIQDFLTGPEYTVGLIGNPATGLTVLEPAEVDYSRLDPDLPPVFTYEAKFVASSRYWQQLDHRRAEIDEITRAQLVEYCTRLYRRLGLRDYARFDFRAGTDGQPRLLDVNPDPTWYSDGRMSMMAQWTGYSYAEMLRMILDGATARYGLA